MLSKLIIIFISTQFRLLIEQVKEILLLKDTVDKKFNIELEKILKAFGVFDEKI